MASIPRTIHLLGARDTGGLATAYRSAHDGLPEPLVAIWEPMAYAAMLAFLAQGRSCPRKVLMNSNCHLLDAPNGPELLIEIELTPTAHT